MPTCALQGNIVEAPKTKKIREVMPEFDPVQLHDTLVKAKAAQAIFANYSQEQVDKIFHDAAAAACSARLPLARLAVAETRMGVVEDKVGWVAGPGCPSFPAYSRCLHIHCRHAVLCIYPLAAYQVCKLVLQAVWASLDGRALSNHYCCPCRSSRTTLPLSLCTTSTSTRRRVASLTLTP